jgi:ketosteroid isomerase-like protein
MSAQDNIRIVREYFDAFNKGDADKVLSYFDNNAESTDMATGIKLHGQQEMRQNFESMKQAISGLNAKLNNIFASDEFVCVEYVIGGTFSGPMSLPTGTFQPTGRKGEVPFCDIYQLRNGKVVTVRTYSDSGTMMKQLGVSFGSPKAA